MTYPSILNKKYIFFLYFYFFSFLTSFFVNFFRENSPRLDDEPRPELGQPRGRHVPEGGLVDDEGVLHVVDAGELSVLLVGHPGVLGHVGVYARTGRPSLVQESIRSYRRLYSSSSRRLFPT